MPLTDFVRYLNAQLPLTFSEFRSMSPFVSDGGRVSVCFGDLRLESAFFPIVDTADGVLSGHVARLNAIGKENHHFIAPGNVFKLPGSDRELVFLDRLVRTLHTLNYLVYRGRHPGGLLLLKVHPRHVASVPADHGLAFEEILRACGLLPEQITLEFEIDGDADASHFFKAITNYKSRGYRIAFGGLGRTHLDFALLKEARPDFVRLDYSLLALRALIRPLIDLVHELGIRTILEGPANTKVLRDDAWESGFDLLHVNTSVPEQGAKVIHEGDGIRLAGYDHESRQFVDYKANVEAAAFDGCDQIAA